MTLPPAVEDKRSSSRAPPSGVLGTTGAPFHDVVDALDQLVVVLSADGDAQYINRAGREYLGLALADWRSAIHPDDLERVVTARAAGEAASTPWVVRVRMRRHDGVYRGFRARVTPLRDRGIATYWAAAFTDVDEAFSLDDNMRDHEERLAALDAASPGVLVSFRRAPNGEVSFPFVSPRYFELTGVTAEGLRRDPQSGYNLVHPDDLAPVLATLETARETLTPWHHAYRVNHPARGIVWIEAHSIPRRDADGGMSWQCVLHDVTERERSAEETRLWANAFRHCNHALVVSDPTTMKVITCNAATLALLGYAEGELVGRDVASFHVDQSPAEVARIVHQATVDGTLERESRLRRKDGSAVDVLVTVVGVRDARGAPLYNISTIRETAASKQAARELAQISESLRTSEERFRLTFHESPAAKALVRLPERVIVDVNDAFLTLNRYRREDLVGKPSSILLADPTADVSSEVAGLLRQGRLEPTARAVRRGDGTTGISEISARTFVLDGVAHAIVVHQDVTARRQAEDALRESSTRFKQLAESIQEVFWLTAVDKQRIVYISPGYETIWGRTCASVIEHPEDWLDAIHKDDRPRVYAALEKQASGKYDEEYRVIRPDGAVRWVHDKAFPVRDEHGALIGVAGVAQDITERRGLEVQLRQAQKLESIGSLAGGIAHDFNNWLTVIGGSTSLLLERTDLDADCLEVLADIKLASVRAAGLTGQLLAFSRKEIIEPQVITLNEIFADTERMLGRVLGEDVSLSGSFAPDLWPVRVDRGQWSQILINLAVNARDAMPRGGQLTVTTSNVTGEAAGTQPQLRGVPHVLVQVTDSGAGMTAEVKARLFEPFFTTKEVGRGTGLGLAVVHGIVAQSGGHIEVDSTLGVGTTFRIYLPALPAKPMSLAPEREQSVIVEGGTETILLVEDEEALRRFVKRGLVRDGYTVLEARDGIEALEVVAAHAGPIDLVVTDIVMPRLGGRELVGRLHETKPDLRVLYTTGYTDDAVLRHGVRQAEVALMAKPFTYAMLRARIRGLLDQH